LGGCENLRVFGVAREVDFQMNSDRATRHQDLLKESLVNKNFFITDVSCLLLELESI